MTLIIQGKSLKEASVGLNLHPVANLSYSIRMLTSGVCLLDWACANHHYDCEWSRCEVWVLLSLPDPRLESARARACALPQPALPPHAPQSTAVQAVVPQSVAFPPASFPPAAPQPAASQTLAAQPVTTHPAPAQRGAQFNGRGALRGTGRGPSRGTTSGGVKSRRGTAGPGRSDNQRQAVLSRVSHGSTQTQPGTLSSVGSGGGNCHISGPGVASYQMPPYQTPYNTAPAQLTFNAMQPPFQGIDPPGRFAQAPFDQPQIWGAPRSQNQNLQFSHPDNSNQGFSEINDHQLGLVARWKSQQRRSEQNNTSLLPRQMPADQTLDLLQLGSQPAAFQQTRSVYGQTQQTLSQQDSPRWVDPRQLTRQQMPAHGGLVSDAAFLQQQMNDQQAAGSAAGGSQDPTNSSRQEYGTMGLDNMAAEPPAVSQHPHENSRDAC